MIYLRTDYHVLKGKEAIRMNDLDTRLMEILKEHRSFAMHSAADGVVMHNSNEAIAQIKQAFADEREKEPGFTAKDLGLMTGKEWLERFEMECPEVDYYEDVMEAAKRASGLEKERQEDK